MIWIIIIIGAVILLSSMKSSTSSVGTTPVSQNLISPTVYTQTDSGQVANYTNATGSFNPPPGYSGPDNGPFTWASAGAPPSGLYTVKGIPAGYGYNASTLQYVWINPGLPPNGQMQVSMS
jgi:hypothetical protein